jgi:hypothetical protein
MLAEALFVCPHLANIITCEGVPGRPLWSFFLLKAYVNMPGGLGSR